MMDRIRGLLEEQPGLRYGAEEAFRARRRLEVFFGA